ncbi:Threonine/homoserine/homoserine lactone efflux protein [Micromonospora citrea]|uniref:Threonine/homoserine/homoserine lactone efflux protein n=1 Tax=Micromonospora citrea TaxID=47855 RepID=A0A1C6W3H2_9ACTN|nr:LysE family translocator [Micromonospora citrea]SCL73052.1 Threonine/homoserine/homoserine lactone efflux protein [Micromonospora citrea]
MTVAFLLTSLLVVATPGTGTIYTLAAGLGRGPRAGLLAAVGCTLGVVPHLAAAVTGLAALLHSSAMAFQVLKYGGVAYLLYLAWMTLRDRDGFTIDTAAPAPSPARVIAVAVLSNLLNPKLTMFFLAFLPQFVRPGAPDQLTRMLFLGAVFMLLTLVVLAAYGMLAGAVRDRVLARPAVTRWLRRGFAGSFVGLGLLLARAEA